jgi:hypothetical protein
MYDARRIRVGVVGALTAGVMLLLAASALGIPPTLSSVGVRDRHPLATFSAPKSDFATIYLASRPDRATDGSFLSENLEVVDLLADSEIQAGRWEYESQVDPGTYYVMLHASPDFDACWDFDRAAYDPLCADGYSSVLPLVVPRPQFAVWSARDRLSIFQAGAAAARGRSSRGQASVSRVLPAREPAPPLHRGNR